MSDEPEALGPVRSTFADDPEMQELVELFVGEMPDRVRALQQCWAEHEAAELQRLAHQLKGASAGYGFATIGDAAAKLEDLIKLGQGDAPDVQQQFNDLIALCSRASL